MNQAEKRPLEDDTTEIPLKKPCVELARIRRKKVAMLLVYSGVGYYGMQKNPGMKTIEDDLLMAMYKADIITKENMDIPQTMMFQRAARTDKGVSAVGQIVSLKIPLIDGGVERILEHLPPCIRVIDYRPTTKGFNSKLSCDARTYSYMLPTFSFAQEEKVTEDYRISNSVVNKVNEILKLFEGTHFFHNFTSGKKPNEPSTQRYIMNMKCGQPFVRDGLEFVIITVKGQSFMLHQIRKMIGLTIAIVRCLTTEKTIQKAWRRETIDIPKAPGLGLVLEKVHFDRYNQRYGSDGMHKPLDWEEFDNVIQNFKEEFIYPPIIEGEKESKSMFAWLATLPFHTFDVRQPGEPSKALQVFPNASHMKEESDETDQSDKGLLSVLNNEILLKHELCTTNSNNVLPVKDGLCTQNANNIEIKSTNEDDGLKL